MLIVLMILVALAGIMLALYGNTLGESQEKGALVTMAQLREAIIGTPQTPGFLTDTGALPNTLADLFGRPAMPSTPAQYVGVYDPVMRRGWRGPYILNPTGKYTVDVGRGFTTAYGIADDTAMLDPWGNPIVLQRHTSIDGTDDSRLVSAGRDRIIQTNPSGDVTTMTIESCGDDKVVFLLHSDERK
jgi:hypothetical protein